MNRFQKAWQALTDRAVSAADRQLGIAAPETSVGQAGAASLEGRPTTGQVLKPTERGPSTDVGLLAPERPVTPLAPAAPTVVEAEDVTGRVQMYGLPATAFPGGFIVSHGEFDQKMYGWEGVKMYERMRRTSAQVDATLECVIQPIISATWDVVAEEESRSKNQEEGQNGHPVSSTGAGKNTAKKAKEIADAAKENLLHNLEWQDARGNWHSQDFKTEVLRSALLEIAMGCSAFEEVYAVDGGALRLARLVDLPPITFYQWDVDQDGRTLRNLIQFGWRRDRYERVSVPAEKICTFTYRQEGADFWGRPMTRTAYQHWYIVEGLYRIDAIAGERNGMGIPCITSGPNPSVEDKNAAREWLMSLAVHEKTCMFVPNGWTFELVGVKGTTHNLFESIIHHNEQISRCALNTFLDMGRGGKEGASGNRSLGESAQEFFWLCLQNEADSIASRITNKTLRRWTYYNYGPGAPVPQLRAANVIARSFQQVSEMLSALAQGALIVSDQEMRDEIRTQLGMPQETRDGLVAVKGETIDVGSGTEVSGRSPGAIDTGSGSQGPQQPGPGAGGSGSGTRDTGAGTRASRPETPAKPPATASRQKQAMQASEMGFSAIGNRQSKIGNLVAPRATPSNFWREGDPEHLRNVYPHESHVDFPGHWKTLRSAESRLRQSFAQGKNRRVRAMASEMARALKAGKAPSQVTFPPDENLKSQISKSVEPIYRYGRETVAQERARLDTARREAHLAKLRMEAGNAGVGTREAGPGTRGSGLVSGFNFSALDSSAPVGIVADLAFNTAEDLDTDLANATRKAAIDKLRDPSVDIDSMDAGELADALFGAIGDVAYVDQGMDAAADAAVRSAFRYGRGDAFDEIAAELAKLGYTLQMIRACAMEKDSCDSCVRADGQPLAPGEDITDIHEGPPESCECEAVESI
jgi:hypothetical protein